MNTETSEETIINLVNVFKILYQVAQREHPELLQAANDNRKNTSISDVNPCNNRQLKKEENING